MAVIKRIFPPVKKFFALKPIPVETASITSIRLQSSSSVSHQSKTESKNNYSNVLEKPNHLTKCYTKNVEFVPEMTDEETKLYIKEPKDIYPK